MPQLNPKQQRELNKLQKQYQTTEDRITAGTKLQEKTLIKHEKTQKRINVLLKIQNELTSEQKDLTKEISKQLSAIDKTQRKLNISGDKFKGLKGQTLDIATSMLTAAKKAVQIRCIFIAEKLR